MANTIKTLSDGDITRKALSLLHNNLVFCKEINKEYDSRFAVSGAKNGGSLLIREPNQFTVRTGAIMDSQDVTESVQTLTVATQKGVDINFSSVELTLSLDDFAERILKPAMARLAADVDATVISGCYPYVYNTVYTTISTVPKLSDILLARARINKGLAPTGDRKFMTEGVAANGIITDGRALFHASSEIERQYTQGLLGEIAGFKFYETEMTPVHTNGDRAAGAFWVNTSATATAGLVSGTATIKVFCSTTTAGDSAFKAGDVFTIANVYAVNPETKSRYAHLQQFSVVTDVSITSAGTTVTISPTPVTSGAKQNVSKVSNSAKAALVVDGAGSNGVASTNYVTSLGFHKDAFTMVTADLEVPRGVDFAAREVYDGISLRLVRNYDITNDKFPCRIDVLFGYKAIRPEWATRVLSAQ
jgi:hypothetical protein